MKIAVGITGASGSIYAKLLIKELSEEPDQIESCGLIFSDSAKMVWQHEIGKLDTHSFPYPVYSKKDFSAPFASGSAGYDAMIICPCSMGTLGRIANGISDDLMTRTADVMLKERKRLILVCRETPLNLIHLKNMELLTQAGAIIFPASPSFYSQPATIEEACLTVVHRTMQLAGIKTNSYKWGTEKP